MSKFSLFAKSCFILVLLSFYPSGVNSQALHNIPENKGLDPQWVKSLYDSGKPTTYLKSRNELKYIGMPVGGINAGGVYLGGDGRLWLWDIFNETKEGVDPKIVKFDRGGQNSYARSRDGANYLEPSVGIRPLEQGFRLKIEYGGKTIYKNLEESDWDEIAFEATYPVGIVHYTAKDIPLDLTLHAYSPFIPLDVDNSAIPATILSFSAKNNGTSAMKVSLVGYLENKCGIKSGDGRFNRRQNDAHRTDKISAVGESIQILKKNDNKLETKPDFGTMCIAAINPAAKIYCQIDTESFNLDESAQISSSLREPLIGGVGTEMNMAPGAASKADFAITWFFPNLFVHPNKIKDNGRDYQNRFTSATDVADYVGKNFDRLSSSTMLWLATWQDTTLPQWFMERTFISLNTLATANCMRFSSGRFWAWEGIGACEGTCTHVWQYAQGMARIFPELERDCRQRTDLGIAMQPNGGIIFRAEMESRPAIDGQAGSVLRCYREHQMSADASFLKNNWPQIKRAVQFILDQDRNGDGMEDTPMENTLDAVWDGEIAWIVGICIAGVDAGEKMATEVGDKEFARKCADYVAKGSKNMDALLFNGEYYIHRPDAEKGRSGVGSYNTCHIDQVLGQAWAFQVGMGRIQDREHTLSALRSLWKYNFTTDVGPYIATHIGGRPYALPGEGGMIMNTNPTNEAKPYGDKMTWQMGYFHECMSGFEHQVAAHMIAEGMTDEGLVLTRMIHDRYHASKRNPFNEVECSDHYARAMASYGSFISACGFEYHGPKGYMRFAPKWSADNFRAPFTAAQGWGTYSQKLTGKEMTCTLEAKYGKVELSSFSVDVPASKKFRNLKVTVDGKHIPAKMVQKGERVDIAFSHRITIGQGQIFNIIGAIK